MPARFVIGPLRHGRWAGGALIAAALCAGLLVPNTSQARSGLSGVVWTDGDRDGVRDREEPGRGGVRVEILRLARRDSAPTIVRSVVTGTAGAWSSPVGRAGFYRARVLQPGSVEGFTQRDRGGDDGADSDVAPVGPRIGMTPLVKLRAGKPLPRFDAGLLAAGPAKPAESTAVQVGGSDGSPGAAIAVGDFVWGDANADGIQAPAEPGIGGVAVELWNPAKTTRLATTTTNSAGYWALPGNAGASYRIRVLAGGYAIAPKQTAPLASLDSDLNPVGVDVGFSDVLTPGASTVDVDAGLYLSFGDLVWDDANSNGIQDLGEPGVAGVQVQLWNAAKTMLHTSTSTDAAGRYEMVVPAAGSYRVRVLVPLGFTGFSAKDAGADEIDSDINPSSPDSGFSDPFNLPPAHSSDLDAGLI